MRISVDGHGKDPHALTARLLHGAAGVFQREAALIMIDIVRLAVRQDEKQALPVRLLDEFGRGVADGGADTGVIARLQPGDALPDGVAHRLAEILDRFHPYPAATP